MDYGNQPEVAGLKPRLDLVSQVHFQSAGWKDLLHLWAIITRGLFAPLHDDGEEIERLAAELPMLPSTEAGNKILALRKQDNLNYGEKAALLALEEAIGLTRLGPQITTFERLAVLSTVASFLRPWSNFISGFAWQLEICSGNHRRSADLPISVFTPPYEIVDDQVHDLEHFLSNGWASFRIWDLPKVVRFWATRGEGPDDGSLPPSSSHEQLLEWAREIAAKRAQDPGRVCYVEDDVLHLNWWVGNPAPRDDQYGLWITVFDAGITAIWETANGKANSQLCIEDLLPDAEHWGIGTREELERLAPCGN